MKIGIVGTGGFYPLQKGAMGIISYEMAKHIADLGHEVSVLVPIKSPSQRKRMPPIKGVSFEFLCTSVPRYFLKGNLEALKIFSHFKSECDIIHYNVPPISAEAFAPFFMRNMPQTYWYLGDVHNYALRFSLFTLNARFLSRIFASCYFIYELLNRMGISSHRIKYVPVGIDVERFSVAKPVKLGGEPSVLYVGRLDMGDKDLGTLLQAFHFVSATIPSSRLHIIGSGRGAKECKQFAKELGVSKSIIWHGSKDNIDLPGYYKGSDMVAYPISQYLSNGMGLVVMEAMAAGKPVITTSFPGNREFIRDGENALLCPLGDYKALAKSVLRLYQDRELAQTIVANGYSFIKEFDWRKVVLKLEAAWKELA